VALPQGLLLLPKDLEPVVVFLPENFETVLVLPHEFRL
jgi:hypothetical protein